MFPERLSSNARKHQEAENQYCLQYSRLIVARRKSPSFANESLGNVARRLPMIWRR